MTGAEIVTMFEGLIDDEIDSTVAYQILDDAKNNVEDEREWAMLKVKDTSQTAGPNPIDLPDNWRRTLKLYVGTLRYWPLEIESVTRSQFASRRYMIDVVNNKFQILGENVSGLITHFYLKTTPEITANTSPVWPERFHKLIAYEMAAIYFAIDQGDRGRSWDDKWTILHDRLLNRMRDWDAQIRTAEANAAPTEVEDGDDFPLGMM
jgi:hypothetical protein